MAIKLVRESSETPNITNQDDARMARYAYSGYTGYVKNHLSEVDYQIDGSKFKLGGGVVVVNGWEVKIEEGSWELDLSTLSGTQHYTVYLSVNVATETARILSVYAPGAYPTVTEGDDLTEDPYGEANVILYKVKAENGSSSEVLKIIEPIPYINDEISKINNEISEINTSLTDTKNTLTGITSGTNSVPKADGVEHLYLHSLTFILHGTGERVEGQYGSVKAVFSVTYSDTSDEVKEKYEYAAKFIFSKNGGIICARTSYSFSTTTYKYNIIQIAPASENNKISFISDGEVIKEMTVDSVDVQVGTPIKLR